MLLDVHIVVYENLVKQCEYSMVFTHVIYRYDRLFSWLHQFWYTTTYNRIYKKDNTKLQHEITAVLKEW